MDTSAKTVWRVGSNWGGDPIFDLFIKYGVVFFGVDSERLGHYWDTNVGDLIAITKPGEYTIAAIGEVLSKFVPLRELNVPFDQSVYHNYEICGNATKTLGCRVNIQQLAKEDYHNCTDYKRFYCMGKDHKVNELAYKYKSQPIICTTQALDKLLEMPLIIPKYQRIFCWRMRQITDLLETLRKFYVDNEVLHLGTIVLHEQDNKQYNVVDGQQRLLALSILLFYLRQRNAEGFSLLSGEFSDTEAIQNVFFANTTISLWLRNYNLQKDEKFFDFLKKSVLMTAVQIPKKESESLAYTFFNAINSSGKKLTDYDLLKAHHLRYVKEEGTAKAVASNWDTIATESTLGTFGDKSKEGMLRYELLDLSLFRVRCWSKNHQVNESKYHLLRHFSASESLTAFPVFSGTLEYNENIQGGNYFFAFVSRYRNLYKEFIDTPPIKAFLSFDESWRHTKLLNVIKAVLFMYYCKFGEVFLSDAVFFVAECLSRLRCRDRISFQITNEDIVKQVVEELDTSSSPEYFFHYCVLPNNRYEYKVDGNSPLIKKSYWTHLLRLYEQLFTLGTCFNKEIEISCTSLKTATSPNATKQNTLGESK
jgi:hypothetical protein